MKRNFSQNAGVKMNFKITADNKDETCMIAIAGSLDSGTCAAAEQKIESTLAKNDGKTEKIILDLKNLRYISSLGLRILFKLAKEYPSRVDIINTPSDIMDVFKMTGIDKTMNVSKAD